MKFNTRINCNTSDLKSQKPQLCKCDIRGQGNVFISVTALRYHENDCELLESRSKKNA